METGIKPRVNLARGFYEIANNFSNNLEVIREALSNSYDANATETKITFEFAHKPGTSWASMIMIEIEDDGDGMSNKIEADNECSDLQAFFNLGDSNKKGNQIGSKGHGSKIYYKSKKIKLETWNNGTCIYAETEDDHLWETLCIPQLPSYCFDEKDSAKGKGTIIKIEDFVSQQNTFDNVKKLKDYILWYTIIGSFGPYFNKNCKKMNILIKSYYDQDYTQIDFGLKFPEENTDLTKGTKDYCKIIGPKVINVPIETGKNATIEIISAFLGENKRDFIPDTYWNTGLWLCKDFIRIKRDNDLLEKIVGGEYWYRNFLILANCQQFELIADRNNIKQDTNEYDKIINAVSQFIKEEIKKTTIWDDFFDKKKEEREQEKQEELKRKEQVRIARLGNIIDNYKKRKNIKTDFPNLLIKEPRNEAETGLLLQSMVSTEHPDIDFKIGAYDAHYGTDLIIEIKRKGSHKFEWAELVYKLSKLFPSFHPTTTFEKIICWEIGDDFEKTIKEIDGHLPELVKKVNGRYNLNIGADSMEVYVLKEILYKE